MVDSLYTADGRVDKHALWQQHAHLVRREALRLRVRLPPNVEIDDLIQAGGLGLLAAIDMYEPREGVPFAGYAVQRIRYAMLDELRQRDWVPRRVRRNFRRVSQTLNELEQELGRTASESEAAERLEVSVEEYRQMVQDNSDSQIFSYEESHEEMGDTVEYLTENHDRQNPFQQVMADEFRQQIIAALETLPEREKLVFTLYYQEELNLREIAEIMEVGESRVSQLHSEAIKRLRHKLFVRRNSEMDFSDIEAIAQMKAVSLSNTR